MTLSLVIMVALALLAGTLGIPMLANPASTRRRWGLRDTPQMTYILRITGTMLAALGLILFVFAATWWQAASRA